MCSLDGQAVKCQKMPAYRWLFLVHCMFEYSEAHFQLLLLNLNYLWTGLLAITCNVPFPFKFSEADVKRIKLDSDSAVPGTELLVEVKETLGDLWPDKGFIEHEQSDDRKAALHEVKSQILESWPRLTRKKRSTSVIGRLNDLTP